MKPTIADFKSRFPEFAELTDGTTQMLIDRGWFMHSQTTEGALLAAAHLHCHDQLPSVLDGGAGVVSSESLGTKKVEYSTNAGADERRTFWSTSKYGREFMLVEQRNVRQAFGMLIGG